MVYTFAHLFGLGTSATDVQTGLPPALKPVEDQQRRARFRQTESIAVRSKMPGVWRTIGLPRTRDSM